MVSEQPSTTVPEVQFGRREWGSVGQLVERHAAVFRALPFVLVASIDSDPDPAEQPWAKKQILADPTWAKSTAPLIVSGDAIMRQHEREPLFTGYDEVWVLDGAASTPPPATHLGSPGRLEGGIPMEVADYLRESGGRLGLGDGTEGLYFVAADLDLAARLGLIDET